jgi:predicted enzyme related to lactoylglutathione lyase
MPTLTTLVYPATDLDNAKAVFTALFGVPPTVDSPYYVGWSVDGHEIGLDPHGDAAAGPTPFWHVPDIEAAITALTEAGATTRKAAADVGGGRLVASLHNADGCPVGLIQDPTG